jgi:hypothetical protein
MGTCTMSAPLWRAASMAALALASMPLLAITP